MGNEILKPETPRPEQPKSPFHMSMEDINRLQPKGFEGRINVVSHPGKAAWAAHDLAQCRMLGFDTETRPSFRKGEHHKTSLLQLSNERHAFLFRLNMIGIPPGLKHVLENPGIIKIGQGLKHELKTLEKEYGVKGQGFIDLLDISHKLNCEPKSLKGMAAIFLGFRIVKSMQVTNWERDYLSPKQVRYAATDAWVSLEIYREIAMRGLLPKDYNPVTRGH